MSTPEIADDESLQEMLEQGMDVMDDWEEYPVVLPEDTP